MSTANPSSPRPSLSIRSPASSSARPSLDLTPSAQHGTGRATTTRRNRAALRDYYNIRAEATDGGTDGQSSQAPHLTVEQSTLSELDRPGFDAGNFVRRLLETEGLEGILRIENKLVGEIRGLDGDRKGLVYDNYSKLISATDTIKKMRSNMDPLTPTTSTLTPAISHIAETATTLSNELSANVSLSLKQGGDAIRKAKERKTVQWVLDTPRRLDQLRLDDRDDEANKEWESVSSLLDKWGGVSGVEDLRRACESIIHKASVG